jgi:hypothetical protein
MTDYEDDMTDDAKTGRRADALDRERQIDPATDEALRDVRRDARRLAELDERADRMESTHE